MSQEKEVIAIILDDVLSFHQHMEETFVMDKGIHDMGLFVMAISVQLSTVCSFFYISMALIYLIRN